MSDYYRIMGNNGERRVYTIPIGGLSPKEAEKQLKEIMSKYKEDVSFGSAGSIGSTGATGVTFSKYEDFFMPVFDKDGCSHKETKDGFYTHPPQKLDTEIKKPWYKKIFKL